MANGQQAWYHSETFNMPKHDHQLATAAKPSTITSGKFQSANFMEQKNQPIIKLKSYEDENYSMNKRIKNEDLYITDGNKTTNRNLLDPRGLPKVSTKVVFSII